MNYACQYTTTFCITELTYIHKTLFFFESFVQKTVLSVMFIAAGHIKLARMNVH